MARPRTLEAGVPVRVKIDRPLLDQVDAYAAKHCKTDERPEGNRSIAIRRLLSLGLASLRWDTVEGSGYILERPLRLDPESPKTLDTAGDSSVSSNRVGDVES